MDGAKEAIQTDGVFVFIGLIPSNHGLDNLKQDEHGFLASGTSFDTQLPGVYVAGDIRSGSTWQIASAVGEGVSAALMMRQYVDSRYPNWHKRERV